MQTKGGGRRSRGEQRERERNKNKQRVHAEASCFSARFQLGFKQHLNNRQQQFLGEEEGLGFGIQTPFYHSNPTRRGFPFLHF